MKERGKGFHKYRSAQEEHRFSQFGTFVQKKRWMIGESQDKIGKHISLSQPQIARIEQGLHLPRDYNTLEKYAEALRLDSSERHELFRLAGYVINVTTENEQDQAVKRGREEDSASSKEWLLNVYKDYTKRIKQVAVSGDPYFAIEMTSFISDELRKVTSTSLFLRSRGQFLPILAQVLFQRAHLYTEISMSDDIQIATEPVIAELRSVAKDIQDNSFVGYPNLIQGYVMYHRRNYVGSIQVLMEAMDTVSDLDNRLEALRALALDWAYLHDKNRYKEVEIKVRRLIEYGKFSDLEQVCETLEGLGRARGLLNLPLAFETLAEGRQYYAKLNTQNTIAPLRDIQLIRSQLEVIKQVSPSDTQLLETIGNEGLKLAQQHGYRRHAMQIKTILERVLN